MKKVRSFCDRCNQEIVSVGQDDAQDFIDNLYYPKDICLKCDGTIQVRQIIARDSAISGKSEKQVAEEWLSMYE